MSEYNNFSLLYKSKLTGKNNNLFFYNNPMRDIASQARAFLNKDPKLGETLYNILFNFFLSNPGRQLALWVEDVAINQLLIKRTIGALYGISQDRITELSPFFLDACKSDNNMPILFNMNILMLIMSELQHKHPELQMGGFDIFLDKDLGPKYLMNGKEINGSHIAPRLKQFHEIYLNIPIRIIPNSTTENAFEHDRKFNVLFIPNDSKVVTLEAVNKMQIAGQQHYNTEYNITHPSLALGG